MSNSCSLQQQSHRAEGLPGQGGRKGVGFQRGPCELCPRPGVWGRMQMTWMSLLEVPNCSSPTLSAESSRSFSIQEMSDFACGTINKSQHRGAVILC